MISAMRKKKRRSNQMKTHNLILTITTTSRMKKRQKPILILLLIHRKQMTKTRRIKKQPMIKRRRMKQMMMCLTRKTRIIRLKTLLISQMTNLPSMISLKMTFHQNKLSHQLMRLRLPCCPTLARSLSSYWRLCSSLQSFPWSGASCD